MYTSAVGPAHTVQDWLCSSSSAGAGLTAHNENTSGLSFRGETYGRSVQDMLNAVGGTCGLKPCVQTYDAS